LNLFSTSGFLSEDHVISHSRHVTGNRVVRMNLANLPGEDDDAGKIQQERFIQQHLFSIFYKIKRIPIKIQNLKMIIPCRFLRLAFLFSQHESLTTYPELTWLRFPNP
jgi:hypothetical protein